MYRHSVLSVLAHLTLSRVAYEVEGAIEASYRGGNGGTEWLGTGPRVAQMEDGRAWKRGSLPLTPVDPVVLQVGLPGQQRRHHVGTGYKGDFLTC